MDRGEGDVPSTVGVGEGDVGLAQGDDQPYRNDCRAGGLHLFGSMKVTLGVTAIWIMGLRKGIG